MTPPPSTPDSSSRSIGWYLLIGVVLYILLSSFSLWAPILLSFLLIVLISLALNPLVYRLRGITHKRRTAASLLTLFFLLVFFLTGWAFLVPFKTSTSRIIERLPEYWERVQKPLIKIEQQAQRSEARMQAEVSSETSGGQAHQEVSSSETERPPAPESEGPLRSGLGHLLQGLTTGFASLASSAAQVLVIFVTMFFGVLFTLLNPRPIIGAAFALVPERHHPKTLKILQRISEFVPQWALATLLAMLSVGLLVFLLMLLLFDFMDALVLGLIAGVFEAIPYIGPILSAVPALLLSVGEGGWTPLWVILAYLFVQAMENNLISPLIMAGRLELHPLAVIFSMLLSVMVFGVLGVLIAAPLVGIVKILYEELYRERLLPSVTDADLDRLARRALQEKPAE